MTEKQIFASAIIAMGLSVTAHANCGLIPFDKLAQIYEPNQRAIIAWNGEEEILVLATDLRASKSTKILQIFPCRNEPTVKKASPRVFDAATEFLNHFYAEQNRTVRRSAPRSGAIPGAAAALPPPGFVAFHEQIGRHNISITQVLDPVRFLPWVEDYLRSQGADTPTVSEGVRDAIKGYIEQGFHWLVYDVVEVGTDLRSNEPIQYRFKTDHLFYPLVLTQTEDKYTHVEIIVLTNGLLHEYPQLPRSQVRVGFQDYPDASSIMDDVVTLDQGLLLDLDKDIAALMGSRSAPMLRRWTLIPDKGSRFFRDLVAR